MYEHGSFFLWIKLNLGFAAHKGRRPPEAIFMDQAQPRLHCSHIVELSHGDVVPVLLHGVAGAVHHSFLLLHLAESVVSRARLRRLSLSHCMY